MSMAGTAARPTVKVPGDSGHRPVVIFEIGALTAEGGF